jgi:hypothetical protein
MQTRCADTTQNLIGLIGANAFYKLSSALGGTDLNVPKTDDGTMFFAIAGIIGNTAAQQLISVFGGDRVYISNGLKHHLATRNDAIRAEFDELTKTLSAHAAIRRLSLSYRLSNRWINAITKRLD